MTVTDVLKPFFSDYWLLIKSLRSWIRLSCLSPMRWQHWWSMPWGYCLPLKKSRCYSVDKTIAYLLIWEIDLKCIKSFVEIFYCQITAQIYNKQLLLHVGLVVDKMWSVVVFSYQLVHLQAVLPCGLSFLRPSLRTFINLDHNPEVLWLFDTPSLSQAYICIIIHLESHAWWNWKHRTRYETQALADEFGIEGLLKLDEPVLEHRLKGWQCGISR